MLINMKEMLEVAEQNHFAVGAFNATESSLFRSVVEEAEAQDAPAIVQVAPGEFDFATREFYTYVRERLAGSRVPFVLHLDHGKNMEQCMKAIQAGFTSVMLDGSELPYEENVRVTREVADLAHMVGVSVEGEVGTIGVMSNSEEGGVEHVTYTDPGDVVDFVNRTGVDCLAIAIGTAHGIYPKGFVPKLQLELLEEIKKVSSVPLVLHGGSNNPDEEIRRACRIGIRKVNISSDFKYAFFKKVNQVIEETGGFIPAKVLTTGICEARKVIREKMELFGSLGKGGLYREEKGNDQF
ncbi:MAG: ketose-bisphosphate aldolase [Clostridium sp.]|nr:ketose-bisphosphate aldolase [Clostridium sp.]